MSGVLYQCDVTKNKECSKSNCHTLGGPCWRTHKEEYAITDLHADGVLVENPLAIMMRMQASFQDTTDPRYKSANLKQRAAFLRDHFVFCDQELQEMLYEIPFFKHWKDYSKMTDVEILAAYDQAKEELVDAWHFFMNLSLGLGMDADELFSKYLGKHQENIRRQKEGYDHTMRHI